MNTKAIIPIILVLCMTGLVNATFLNTKTESCTSSWYCTTYSQNDCGIRSCVDINLCDTNKPTEIETCRLADTVTNIPPGYFTLSKDAIKITLEQEKVIQQIVTVNSSASQEHSLEILYPSSYTKGTDFITTSSNKKVIDQKGDFNIIIDTRSILSGTYVIPINISNKDYSRTIVLIIDVVPKNSPKIVLDTNSKLITLEKDKEISVSLKAKGIDIVSGNKLTYELIDSKGNVILAEEKSFSAIDNQERLTLPKDITEGRYTLSAKIFGTSATYVKSITFTTVTPDKYDKISTSQNKTPWLIIIIAIIVVGIAAFLINKNMPYRPYSKRKQYKYYGGVGILKSSFGKPSLSSFNLDFGVFSGLKNAIKGVGKIERELDTDKKIDLLKKSYDRGFISLKEYHDSLRAQGLRVEGSVIQEHHKEIQTEKKEERASKQTKQERNLEKEMEKLKEEREKQQKEKEKQQKEMEKAEAEVLKQEEALKKELEHQKELREKQERELKEREIQKNKEIERIKSEIEVEQKEIEKLKKERLEVREEHKPVHIIKHEAEKPSVSPMAHLVIKDLAKENVLNKKVGNEQAFGLNNGEKLYCLRDLLEALPHIQEHVFNHHTKHGRNDFANWIGDVFKYYDIAEQIRDSDTKEEMIRVLKQYE